MNETKGISFFERYLTLWVFICMVIGVGIAYFIPALPAFLNQFTVANISIPIAILIWIMIYPMMLKVDFESIKNVRKNPKGLMITWIINWMIKPFTMFGIAWLFFMVIFQNLIPAALAKEYVAGAILLGAAPCTAMVFVWSYLTKGDAAYTLVQVATNDLLILILFVPIVALLLGVSGIQIPFDTLFLSILLFVVIPLVFGFLTRHYIVKNKGIDYLNQVVLPKFNTSTMVGLLLTLILIFSFQGTMILENPVHIILIAIPLILQTFLIFGLAYGSAKWFTLDHSIAAPCGMIGASNFFELAVAVAIAVFGASSPVVLATVVGVLVEVPVMLILVKFANHTRRYFK